MCSSRPLAGISPCARGPPVPPPPRLLRRTNRCRQPARSQPRPFHWSQPSPPITALYSQTPRHRLPTQTLRDIISADVDSLYARKRRSCIWTMPLLPPPCRGLKNRVDRQAPRRAARSAAARRPERTAATKAAMPLVFQNVDLDALKLQDGSAKESRSCARCSSPNWAGPIRTQQSAYYERWKRPNPMWTQCSRSDRREAFMKMQSASADIESQTSAIALMTSPFS